MRRKPLVIAAAAAAALLSAVPAHAGILNPYHDGQDLAVASANGSVPLGLFRLATSANRLEPNCTTSFGLPGVDVGDFNTSFDIVNGNATYSIDQVLVPGQRTGYRVVNTFDTGSPGGAADPDIDIAQWANNIDGPMYRDSLGILRQDNVVQPIIICYSDHEDAGQNEPYAASTTGNNEVRDANEVYAKNRPIIQPTVASLGQGLVNAVQGYKLGLGYSVARWYSLANAAAGGETPLLRLRDPMAFNLDKPTQVPVLGGSETRIVLDNEAGHVVIPPRINGPRFNAAHDGPGVLRVNDIDFATEQFGDAHREDSNYGQTVVFNVNGDAQSFCLGGNSCAGIAAFGAPGDLPMKWTVKASLAATDTSRDVSFTVAQFDSWMQGWQDYYCGKGAKPTLPLTPGTKSPDFRGGCVTVVNPVETRPGTAPQVAVSVAAPVVNVTTPRPAAANGSTCTSNRQVKFVWPSSAKKGKLVYRGRSTAAKRSNGRLRATADLRGMTATPGDYMRVTRHMTTKNGKKSRSTSSFKVC